MLLDRVHDLRFEDVLTPTYDLALFSSGYEPRCTSFPRLLTGLNTRQVVVLGFSEVLESEERRAADEYYKERWDVEPIVGSANRDEHVYEILRESQIPQDGHVRILVDYSSMSRLWYSAILNWARYIEGPTKIDVDLVYSVGDHQKSERLPMVIHEMMCLPGCEGGAPLFNSVAVFGLGFEGAAALCVLDRLEPDKIYSYYADPAAFPEYASKAKEANRDLIAQSAAILPLPLTSVERSFSHLAELVQPHRKEADITIIPMGPKPHVLAAILLCIRFEEIACLRVAGKRTRSDRVASTGDLVLTQVQFRGRDENRTGISGSGVIVT
jgi:hypothetical protein